MIARVKKKINQNELIYSLQLKKIHIKPTLYLYSIKCNNFYCRLKIYAEHGCGNRYGQFTVQIILKEYYTKRTRETR